MGHHRLNRNGGIALDEELLDVAMHNESAGIQSHTIRESIAPGLSVDSHGLH